MKLNRENKGFSLIELIIVIAIFSVVSVAIGGFLLAAQRSYAVSANELDIQEEAQLVANQLQEMILDTSLGISYQYVVVDETGTELIDYMTDDASTVLPEGDLAKKELFIYGLNYYYHIYWNKETSELYLVEYEKIGATSQPVDGMTSAGVVLGEFVTDFDVNLSHVASDKMVSFDVEFKKPGGDRAYTVSRNISIRNNILMNKSSTDIYESVGMEFEPVADVLTIDPSSAFKWPGDSLQFSVVAICTRGGVPSQDVNWSYSSGDGISLSADTKVNASGVLQVGSDEESTVINLVGSMPGKNYTTGDSITLKKDIVINVRQITGMSIVKNDFATTPVVPGGRYEVDVKLTGVNISDVTLDEAGGIDATIEMGNSFATIIDEQDLGALTKRFVIELSSTAPMEGQVALSFKPGRAEFSNVVGSTGVYKVGDTSTRVFKLTSESGEEWLRLGASKVSLAFTSTEMENTYSDGTNLKSGYFVRYYYQVYDSDYVLQRTAYKSTGTNGNLYTDYFTSTDSLTTLGASVLKMSDKVFLTSGTVVVRADLMHNTAGAPSLVGSSNEISFSIPEVSVGYRRAEGDVPSSNLTVYITKEKNTVPVYINLASGYSAGSVSLNTGLISCTPSELAKVSNVDLAKFKAVITGESSAQYLSNKSQMATFKYGSAYNGVSVYLVEPNISGTSYYAPLNNSEWTVESSVEKDDVITNKYVYFMDDTHKMNMTYVDGVFEIATYSIYENNVWKKVADYSMNRVTTSWDVVTP